MNTVATHLPEPPRTHRSRRSFQRTLESAKSTMMFSEIVKLAIDSFRTSKVRFALTALGMVIGSASVILVATIGITGKQYILDELSKIGTNMVDLGYSGGGAAGNNDPVEFSVSAPDIAPDYLGPFEGRSVGNRYVYYLFLGTDDDRYSHLKSPPFHLTEGTIELPAMIINGIHYDSQILSFKQTKYFEISPVNC